MKIFRIAEDIKTQCPKQESKALETIDSQPEIGKENETEEKVVVENAEKEDKKQSRKAKKEKAV